MSETNPKKLLSCFEQEIRDASGRINSPMNNCMSLFLYELMIDGGVSPGDLEKVLSKLMKLSLKIESGEELNETKYTNGWVAQYAEFLTVKLLQISEKMKGCKNGNKT